MRTHKTDEQGRIGNITMHRGDILENANGRFKLLFEEHGDVIVYDVLNRKPIYSTGTFGTKAKKLVFENFAIFLQTSNGTTIWQGYRQLVDGIHYNDDGIDGDDIFFDDFGILKIFSKYRDKPIWFSRENWDFRVLHENDEIWGLRELKSPTGKFRLTLAGEGVVIRNNLNNSDIRERKINAGNRNGLLLKFANGKIKIGPAENGQFRSLHESNNTLPGQYAELSDCGSLLIFDHNRNVIWSSDKNFIQRPEYFAGKPDDDLFPCEFFKFGGRDRILSSNRFYELANSPGGYVIRRAEDGSVLFRFPKAKNEELLAETLIVQNSNRKTLTQEEPINLSSSEENQGNKFLVLTDAGSLLVNRAKFPSYDFSVIRPKNSISNGEKLIIGEALYSLNREYCFEFKNDEWILYRTKDGLILFSTNIKGNHDLEALKAPVKDFYAFLADGIFNIGIQGVWSIFFSGPNYKSSAKAGGEPEAVQPNRLEVTNDGTLALFYDSNLIWKTPCSRRGKHDAAIAQKGVYLISPNKRFLLKSENYSLVLLDTISNRILYNTHFMRAANHDPYLVTTGGGYSLVRDRAHVWTIDGDMSKKSTISDSDGWAEDSIAITDAGYIEIYEAGRCIWRSKNNTLYAEQILSNSDCLLSSNHMFSFYICKEDGKPKIKDFGSDSIYEVKLFQNKPANAKWPKFLFRNGNLRFIGQYESPVWVSGTCDGQSLHLSDDGQLSICNEDGHVVWTTERVACLAWGSLVWDPGSLPTTGRWYSDGPMVPVEFARQSQDGRITLVLQEGARPVPSLWGLMTSKDLNQAIRDLALREKIPTLRISETVGVWMKGLPSPPAIPDLATWANSKGIDSVIWTNLPGKLVLKNGLHSESGMPGGTSTAIDKPSKEQIVNYLIDLNESDLAIDKRKRHLAERYIRRTPRQVSTAYRDLIEEKLGWKYDPYFE